MSATLDIILTDKESETTGSDIYFCAEGSKAELIERRDFPSEKKQAIRMLHGLDKRWNAVIALHFGLWLLSGAVAVSSNFISVDIVCYLTGGLALSTLSVLSHESSHNLLTRNPRIDRWIGFACGIPILFSAIGYRIMHPMHHKHLRTESDPDDVENITTDSQFLRFLYFFIFFFAVYLYLVTVPVNAYKRGTKREKAEILFEAFAMVLLVTAGWMIFPARVMVKAWLMPLLVAGQIANIRGIAEHGLTSKGNELINARTIATNPALSFLMCNINYHLEHHLYPGVPWYNLPKLHAILRDEYYKAGSSVYTSYTAFLWDVAQALVNGVSPGTRLIPAHIREHVCL